jgi:hypothetical protein
VKFSKVVFTHPIQVTFDHPTFKNSIGTLTTLPNQTTTPVDSIEEFGIWLIVRLGDQVRSIPAASVDCCDVIPESLETKKGKAA